MAGKQGSLHCKQTVGVFLTDVPPRLCYRVERKQICATHLHTSDTRERPWEMRRSQRGSRGLSGAASELALHMDVAACLLQEAGRAICFFLHNCLASRPPKMVVQHSHWECVLLLCHCSLRSLIFLRIERLTNLQLACSYGKISVLLGLHISGTQVAYHQQPLLRLTLLTSAGYWRVQLQLQQ